MDSGAFSEVGFGPNGPFVKENITDAEWQERLAVMLDVVRVGGPSVTALVPDLVGFKTSLGRFTQAVSALVATGTRVLIPFSGVRWMPAPSI